MLLVCLVGATVVTRYNAKVVRRNTIRAGFRGDVAVNKNERIKIAVNKMDFIFLKKILMQWHRVTGGY